MRQNPTLLELVRSIGQIFKTHLPRCSAICVVALALAASPRPARALTINVTYDSSVTGSSSAAQIESAYNLAVQNLETLYTNPTTVNITVFWGNYGFGSSQSQLIGLYSYSQLVTAMQNNRTTPEDTNAVASLPASDPTAGNDWLVPRAELKNFPGLASIYSVGPNDSVNDGDVYFQSTSSTLTWTFNPLSRAVPGEYDFIAVAEHETSEVLGRVWNLNQNVGPYYIPYDLFRFTNGVRTLNAFDTGVYFSVNNGVTALKPFNPVTPSNYTMEDPQDWTPANLTDSYDWQLGADKEGILSSADLTSLDIIGYDLNFHAPKAAGTRLANGNFEITFTNVTGLGFTVWGTTNIDSPATNWVNLGTPTESSVGHYQFTDTTANKTRFYRVELQ